MNPVRTKDVNKAHTTIWGKPVKKRKRLKYYTYQRYVPKYDYMKYNRVVRYWAMKTYNITTAELDMLFAMYTEGLWCMADFKDRETVLAWDKLRVYKLMQKGLVHIWRKGSNNEKRLYELTKQARHIVTSCYKFMNMEAPIPTSERRNPVMRPNTGYMNARYAKAILQFNQEVKRHLGDE